MIRRLALIVALLSPVSALAQAVGTVLITPTAFGSADCGSAAAVTLTWTSSASFVAGANEIYGVWVSHTDATCPSSGNPPGTQLPGGNITATATTQTYLTALTRGDLIAKAGITTCDTNQTIFVCVQHWPSAETTGQAKGTAVGSAKLEVEAPPVPVNPFAETGDSALFVTWSDGTKKPDGTTSTVAALSYNVTAVAIDPADPADTHTQNFTGKFRQRISGLTNTVTYSVTVTSLSAGTNESAPSVATTGTPQAVDGFWEQYQADQGVEQGGCSGGQAGLISLLGVALGLRRFRRRS
jgi:hypothetical protein